MFLTKKQLIIRFIDRLMYATIAVTTTFLMLLIFVLMSAN